MLCLVSLTASATQIVEPHAVLQQDLNAFFDQREARVAPFVAWTYAWAPSYANSYLAAGAIAASLWQHPQSFKVNVLDVLSRHNRKRQQAKLTQPEQDAAELTGIIDRHWRGRLIVLQSQLISKNCGSPPARNCVSALAPGLEEMARQSLAERASPRTMAIESQEGSALLDISDGSETDLIHAMRPITSRIFILILRVTELTTIVVFLMAALRTVYVPNTLPTRILITLVLSWGLDYCVLLGERLANESKFEASIGNALKAQRPKVTAYVDGRLRDAESSFLAKAEAFVKEQPSWQ